MQTKRESMIETIVGITIGFIIAVLSQVVIFPYFGIHIKFEENLQIATYFTVISIIRSYLVRRGFNKLAIHRAHKQGLHNVTTI